MSDELEHSSRGPSGAHRWRRCPGSVEFEKQFPERVGREAAEGSVFHHVAACCLMFGLEPEDFTLGQVYHQDGYEIKFDDDMRHYMHAGLDWLRERIEPGDIVVIEAKVDISPWAGAGQFGTCDVAIVKPAKLEIIVFDWKYGKGVVVVPTKNDQCYLYGLGVWRDVAQDGYLIGIIDARNVKVQFHIEQPRAPGGGGTWDTTMDEILAEGVRIREDALATMAEHPPRIPGEKQCLFCRASGRCPEQTKYLLEVMGQKFDEVDDNIRLGVGPSLKDPEKLTAEVRSWVLLNFKAFKRWVEEIRVQTLRDLQAGREVPLLKAIHGKPGHRFYRDVKEAETAMIELLGRDKAFETKLISPATAEKLAGKKKFRAEVGPYIGQPPGKPILVPIEDPRPALQDFASKFDEIEMDEDDDETGD